jgi:hypothetical protein
MYAGNATVVSILMRWPILIPVAISCAIITELPPVEPAPVPPPPVQIMPPPPIVPLPVPRPELVPTPLPPLKKPPPDIRTKCPPPEKTKHLSKGAKEALRHYGCKVNG